MAGAALWPCGANPHTMGSLRPTGDADQEDAVKETPTDADKEAPDRQSR